MFQRLAMKTPALELSMRGCSGTFPVVFAAEFMQPM
jgi:hypothetical protein